MSLCRLSEEALKERVGEAFLEIFEKDQEAKLKEVHAVLKEIMKQEKREKQQNAQQNRRVVHLALFHRLLFHSFLSPKIGDVAEKL